MKIKLYSADPVNFGQSNIAAVHQIIEDISDIDNAIYDAGRDQFKAAVLYTNDMSLFQTACAEFEAAGFQVTTNLKRVI